MARSASFVHVGLMSVLLTSLAHGQAVPTAQVVRVSPLPAVTEPTVSPKLTKLFAGAPPKFEPPKPETVAPATTPVASVTDQPRNTIVRLPTFVVRDSYRLPDDYHMLTPRARKDAVVKRYVGEPTGLDVLLNKYTINTLWKKIPVLGSISDWGSPNGDPSLSYSDRIALDYSKIEAKRLYIEALGVSADVPPSPAKPKDEKTPSAPADK